MVHLWLGINTRSKALHVGRLNPRDSSVGWPDDQPLERVIASQFRQKTLIAIEDELSFNDSFTVVNLKDICLVQIWWTDNLFDHLKLEGPRGKRILSMYRRKPCLINHCNADSSAIFGIDVVEEAIRTLDLLFLFGDTKTRKFLGEEGVRFHNTRPSRLSKPTNLCEFHYWRGNLGLLLKLMGLRKVLARRCSTHAATPNLHRSGAVSSVYSCLRSSSAFCPRCFQRNSTTWPWQ
jgi:hypothetical protein